MPTSMPTGWDNEDRWDATNMEDMVEWDDPWHLTVNILTTLVLVAAAAWVVSPAAKPVRHGWMSKLLWVLALCASIYVAGYYVPLGPLFVLREARKVATDRGRKVPGAR